MSVPITGSTIVCWLLRIVGSGLFVVFFVVCCLLFAAAFVRGHRVLAVWSIAVPVAIHSRIHTFDITALAVVASLLAHTPCPGIAASICMLTL